MSQQIQNLAKKQKNKNTSDSNSDDGNSSFATRNGVAHRETSVINY